MTTAYIWMNGQPIGKGRPRFTRMGRVYTPEKTRKYEMRLAAVASDYMVSHGLEVTSKPCSVLIKAQFEIPKSWTKAKKEAARNHEVYPGKPDIDNLAKVLDAFNEIVWNDDSQVHELRAFKIYAEDPCLITTMTW